jgi:hypothetical protein
MRRNITILILLLATTSLWAQSENSKGGYDIPAGETYKINGTAHTHAGLTQLAQALACNTPSELTLDTSGDLAIPNSGCFDVDTFDDAASDTYDGGGTCAAGTVFALRQENASRDVILSASGMQVYGAVDQTLDEAGDIAYGFCAAANTPVISHFIDAAGEVAAAQFRAGDGSGSLPLLIAAGAEALDTDEIASEACDVSTATATGTLTTDVIIATLNGTPIGVTGYVPATTGTLYAYVYPTADVVNISVCNNTAGAITPGALTVNWMVLRSTL